MGSQDFILLASDSTNISIMERSKKRGQRHMNGRRNPAASVLGTILTILHRYVSFLEESATKLSDSLGLYTVAFNLKTISIKRE